MAIHAPRRPNRDVSSSVSVIRTPHILAKFSTELSRELPAPWNTPAHTMAAPNSGSANTTIRSTSVPSATTSASGLRIPMIHGARKYMAADITAIMDIPSSTVTQPSRVTRSRRLAPTLWPISVTAALCTP